MGITYQTANGQRRKVMTAPLSAPPDGLQGEAAGKGSTGPWRGTWRRWAFVGLIALLTAAGVTAMLP